MNRPPTEELVKTFYQQASLPPERAREIARFVRAAGTTSQAIESPHVPRRSVGREYALAACVALFLLGTVYFARQAVIAQQKVAALQSAALQASSRDTAERAAPSKNMITAPRLVAVRLHADWCGRCPEIAPIFAQIMNQYRNEPVQFVTLDFTNEATRERAQVLAAALRIDWLATRSFETGMVKLVDTEKRETLAILTARGDLPRMTDALAQALPRRP